MEEYTDSRNFNSGLFNIGGSALDYHTISLIMKYAKDYGHARIRDAGISDTEHKICAFLYFHSDVSQDHVADALMMDKTTVAKALLSLEKKEFINRVRNPENRRKNVLTITDMGKVAISDILHIYDAWLENVLSCLSEEERRQFSGFCERLLEKAKIL